MPNLTALTPNQFENLTLDLMQLLGLKNCVWRTPGRDSGRDIQGEFFSSDFSGFTRKESWYIECKRYTDSVSWPIVWEKIAYADSNSADILFFVTSSSLSPQAVDEVNRWNEANKKPTVRFWGGQDLLNKIELFPQLLIKYGFSTNPIVDSAVSILPLTKILTKYANAGSAHSAFGKNKDRIDDVVQALAELISAKIEEVESFGKTILTPFKADKDGYSWAEGNQDIESTRIDRYTARALLALIRCHSPTQIKVNSNHNTLQINCSFPAATSFKDDLQVIALWGSVKIQLMSAANRIDLTNESD